jgi:HlyD family secretion protein
LVDLKGWPMSREEAGHTNEVTVLGPPTHALIPAPPKLPVAASPIAKRRRLRLRQVLLLLAFIAAIGGGYYWWSTQPAGLPPGIASGNGRLEADEIDIDTKFPERVAKLFVDEGDLVKAGQLVALMDARDYQAQLRKAQATAQQAERTLAEAQANVKQQQTLVVFARQELMRARELAAREFMSRETLDQRVQLMNAADAGLTAAQERVGEAERALDAAKHDVELLDVDIADSHLTAPVDGVIQYKISNVGEMLPVGGKIFTMLDTAYVYMDIYLPTADAGQVRLGDDALIVLDALSGLALPSKVVFLATEAQFTPKAVETKTERDKLMFRVRVRIDPDLLRAHRRDVRTGLPGVAYVRFDRSIAWPNWLQTKIVR